MNASKVLQRDARLTMVGLAAVLSFGHVACERSKPTPKVAPSSTAPSSHGCATKLVGDSGYACALLASGNVQCWGRSVPTVPGFLQSKPVVLSGFRPGAKDVLVEGTVACASYDNGELWCGGGSSRGQLVRPWSEERGMVPQLQPFVGVTHLTLQGGCVLARDGVWCWELMKEPKLASLPARAKQLVGGPGFACALLDNHQVFCRGINTRGQLGILEGETDEERERSRTRKYEVFERVRALGDDTRVIASGGRHSCALRQDGSVWCWGENGRGQLGRGDVSECRSGSGWLFSCRPEEGLVPSRVQGLPGDIQDLALGATTSCAIDGRGDAWCWGSLPEPTLKPTQLDVGEPVRSLSLDYQFCVLTTGGVVHCQGDRGPYTQWNGSHKMSLDCP
jgi:alpha-tubulin suppressor-like RCC1 family protein